MKAAAVYVIRSAMDKMVIARMQRAEAEGIVAAHNDLKPNDQWEAVPAT